MEESGLVTHTSEGAFPFTATNGSVGLSVSDGGRAEFDDVRTGGIASLLCFASRAGMHDRPITSSLLRGVQRLIGESYQPLDTVVAALNCVSDAYTDCRSDASLRRVETDCFDLLSNSLGNHLSLFGSALRRSTMNSSPP